MTRVVYYYILVCAVIYLINHGCQLVKYKNVIANLKFIRNITEGSIEDMVVSGKEPPIDGIFPTLALSFVPIANISYLVFVLRLCFLTTESKLIQRYKEIFQNYSQNA